mgnify:CR=1 FL=1
MVPGKHGLRLLLAHGGENLRRAVFGQHSPGILGGIAPVTS